MSGRLRGSTAPWVAAALIHAFASRDAYAQPAPPTTPAPAPTSAAPATPATPATVTAEARERFDRGLKLFNDGDNAGALAEFQRAYALIPNALVLYNIGLVDAALGRPVDAVDALDKVLASPGAVTGDRLARAKQVHDEQAQRVAEIVVVTSVPATIELDGVQVGQTPVSAPLRIASGVHVVGAVASGYAPLRKEVTIAGAQRAEVRLDLVPIQALTAHLTVKTRVPATEVTVDGKSAGTTPLAQSLTVPAGPHTIELRRAGYVTAHREITLGEGASGEVALDPEEDPNALDREGGRLALESREQEVTVAVDGVPRGVYVGALHLPRGLHRLRVERGGFEPLERDVDVAAGRTTTEHVALDPTPDTRAAYVSRTTSQRTWGIVATASGIALVGVGVGVVAWSASQQHSAQDDLGTAEANVQNKVGVCDTASTQGNAAACNRAVSDAQTRVSDAKGHYVFGYVGIGVGAAATAFGLYLLFSNDDPHRYDKPETAKLVRALPFAWGDPHGAGVGFKGSF